MQDPHRLPTSERNVAPSEAGRVRASFSSMEEARDAIERLEDEGVPADAINLTGGVNEEGGGYDSERHLFSDLTKAALIGGAIGAVVGAILGALLTIPFPEVGLVLAAVLGAIFGAGAGGAIGGLSATKYNSRAWSETYEAVPEGRVTVEVAHADGEVVEDARKVLDELGR